MSENYTTGNSARPHSARVSFTNGFTVKNTRNLERLKAIGSVPIVGKHRRLANDHIGRRKNKIHTRNCKRT